MNQFEVDFRFQTILLHHRSFVTTFDDDGLLPSH